MRSLFACMVCKGDGVNNCVNECTNDVNKEPHQSHFHVCQECKGVGRVRGFMSQPDLDNPIVRVGRYESAFKKVL